MVKEASARLILAKKYGNDVRVNDLIRLLYGSCCAFCQCSMEETSFFQIEHFYPKGKTQYKKFIKSIENLHYGCQRCNTLKSTPPRLKIFSPNFYLDKNENWVHSDADKIERELYFVGHLLYSRNINKGSVDRGQETIDLFNLNNEDTSKSSRQHLVEARLRTYNLVYTLIDAIYSLLSLKNKAVHPAVDSLFVLVVQNFNRNSSFSTMLIQNFGNDIYKLLNVYQSYKKNGYS